MELTEQARPCMAAVMQHARPPKRDPAPKVKAGAPRDCMLKLAPRVEMGETGYRYVKFPDPETRDKAQDMVAKFRAKEHHGEPVELVYDNEVYQQFEPFLLQFEQDDLVNLMLEEAKKAHKLKLATSAADIEDMGIGSPGPATGDTHSARIAQHLAEDEQSPVCKGAQPPTEDEEVVRSSLESLLVGDPNMAARTPVSSHAGQPDISPKGKKLYPLVDEPSRLPTPGHGTYMDQVDAQLQAHGSPARQDLTRMLEGSMNAGGSHSNMRPDDPLSPDSANKGSTDVARGYVSPGGSYYFTDSPGGGIPHPGSAERIEQEKARANMKPEEWTTFFGGLPTDEQFAACPKCKRVPNSPTP